MSDRRLARIEPTHEVRIGIGPDGDTAGREAGVEAGVAGGRRNAVVGVAEGVGDAAQSDMPAARSSSSAPSRIARPSAASSSVVSRSWSRVWKPISQPAAGECGDVLGAQPAVVLLAAEALEQRGGEFLALARGQGGDGGDRTVGIVGPEQLRADVGVQRPVEPLPPEARRAVQRGAGEKEGRRGAGAARIGSASSTCDRRSSSKVIASGNGSPRRRASAASRSFPAGTRW